MTRAFLPIRLTLVLFGGLATMVTAATPAGTRVSAPSAGASLAPKAVVSNPYHVPLLQNASSLRSSR